MSSRRVVVVLSSFLLLVVGGVAPRPARAAEKAVLYEVTENMKLKGHQLQRRLATAALMGWIEASDESALCPQWLADLFGTDRCAITALASDNINLGTGLGPVKGDFAVVVQDNNPVDGPEAVIVRGTIDGTIDLSPAVLGADGDPSTPEDSIPLGTLTGRWTAKGLQGGPLEDVRARGTLTGTFRLPFVLPPPAPDAPVYLLNAATVEVEPVHPEEFSLDIPTVRLEITFTQE